jgi:hypothetical protein
MNVPRIYLLLFLSTLASALLRAEIDPMDEPWIPFQAEIIEDMTVGASVQNLPAGLRFVVVRVEADTVIADISRIGTVEIPLKNTNIQSQIDQARAVGEIPIPRMAHFLSNRIVSGQSGWELPLRSPEVIQFERWILLYADSDSEATRALISRADSYYQNLTSKVQKNTALVLMDPSGNKAALNSIRDDLEPSFQMMPGYLSRGYSKSFAHLEDGELPILVEVSSSGRILHRIRGIEEISKWLSEASQ